MLDGNVLDGNVQVGVEYQWKSSQDLNQRYLELSRKIVDIRVSSVRKGVICLYIKF